ncbi:MAG TPA: helix-turn-helix transcriptional regulator [Actinomycetota bacterium]|nr:helix-turn-helix transcriptional regulator [Actinomycetota bacterium]
MARRFEPRSINPASSAVRQLGDALYNLRLRAGLTQQELADLSGGRWSRSHIGRVENGDVTPSLDFVETMDALLAGDRSLVGQFPLLLLETAEQRSRQHQRRRGRRSPAPPSMEQTRVSDEPPLYTLPSTPPQTAPSSHHQGERAVPPDQYPPDEERSAANRSQFLRMALWTGLGAVLESLRLTLRVEGPAGGPVTHEQLELAVRHYARVYWAMPAGVLFHEVRQCRQLVGTMLDQPQPERQVRHLHLVAGWLSALLGNLAFHLGDYTGARAHLGTAGRLGQAAGHHGLIAWVRGAQSMVALYDGRVQEALSIARQGQAFAPSPLARAQLASWGEARALARMGDRGGVLEAIVRGSRDIESSQDDQSPGGVFSFSAGEFEQYCGTACLWLKLPREARQHVEQAFELRDTAAAKAMARLDLAAASSQLDDPVEASQIATAVLDMPADYLIDPIVRRASELSVALGPHRSLPQVRDFHERLASLLSSSGER